MMMTIHSINVVDDVVIVSIDVVIELVNDVDWEFLKEDPELVQSIE